MNKFVTIICVLSFLSCVSSNPKGLENHTIKEQEATGTEVKKEASSVQPEKSGNGGLDL